MKSPWKDNDVAFEPMFTESVVIAHEGKKQTIEAAVFIDNTADAIVDEALDTDIEEIRIVCKKKDWGYVSKLARGDEVQRSEVNGVRYKISEVKADALMGWCIYARSV